MLFAEAIEPTGQTAIAIIAGTIGTVLAILVRDGGPMLYKLLVARGKQESVKARIKRQGQESVVEWLEQRIVALEKNESEFKEEICGLQTDHQNCLIKTTRLESELKFANEKISALEAWKSRRGGSDSILVPPETPKGR